MKVDEYGHESQISDRSNCTLDKIMEPHMYNAVCRMVATKCCRESILSKQEQRQWYERLKQFSVREDGGLLWKGLKVPTLEQLENVLQPIHYKNEKWHCRDMQVLRGALMDRGFALPVFLGGLERASNL